MGRTGRATALNLADKIPARPHTLFVGINPAIRSAQVGHYYAHPSNAFWRIMAASGIEPRACDYTWDDKMVKQGFGFTDVVKRPTVGAADVALVEFKRSRERLENLIRTRQPKTVAFVSKTAARAYFELSSNDSVNYGPQPHRISKSVVWFLPSTSGQSYGDTSFAEKVQAFRALRNRIARVQRGRPR